MANLRVRDTGEYPVSQTEADRRIRAYASCGPVINYDEFGYDVVFAAPPPAYDSMTQYASEIAPELTNKGTYQQTYEILPLSAAQLEANQARRIAQNNERIKDEIAALDLKRIRPLAEGDGAYLSNLNAQIVTLRMQLK